MHLRCSPSIHINNIIRIEGMGIMDIIITIMAIMAIPKILWEIITFTSRTDTTVSARMTHGKRFRSDQSSSLSTRTGFKKLLGLITCLINVRRCLRLRGAVRRNCSMGDQSCSLAVLRTARRILLGHRHHQLQALSCETLCQHSAMKTRTVEPQLAALRLQAQLLPNRWPNSLGGLCREELLPPEVQPQLWE